MINKELMYAKTHEWLKDLGEGKYEVGLSYHAQDELGDIVFVNLPEVGDEAVAGEQVADIESVKAVSDIYSPVSGVICEINEELLDAPEAINENPYGAWLYRVEGATGKSELMDAGAYERHISQEV